MKRRSFADPGAALSIEETVSHLCRLVEILAISAVLTDCIMQLVAL